MPREMISQSPVHTVLVWLVQKYEPHPDDKDLIFARLIPTGEFEPEWEIRHPVDCDSLKYDEECYYDQARSWLDTSDFPKEPGVYSSYVWCEAITSLDYVHPEYDEGIEFERVSDLPSDYPARVL